MDNERPIEKLLRAFAKKRRDAAPEASGLELHPATRRLLQGEVSRQYPRQPPAGTPWTQAWARLWPRFAWAIPVLALLGVGAWVLVHPKSKTGESLELAKNSPKPAETPAVASAALDRTKMATAERTDSNTVAISGIDALKKESVPTTPMPTTIAKSMEGALAASNTPTPVPATPPVALPSDTRSIAAAANPPKAGIDVASSGFAGGGRGGRGGGGGMGTQVAANSLTLRAEAQAAGTVAMPKAAAESQAYNNITAANTEQLTQNFAQVALRAQGGAGGKAAPESQVLDNFQVEQNGNQLRVIDKDGSTYTGSIETAVEEGIARQVQDQTQAAKFKDTAVTGPAKVPAQQVVADQAANIQNAQNYAFRVSGFNNTVKQPVVFTGNLLIPTNAPGASQITANVAGFNSNQLQRAQQVQPLLQNSSINGTAQIGEKQQIQINAVPIQPPR